MFWFEFLICVPCNNHKKQDGAYVGSYDDLVIDIVPGRRGALSRQ